MTLTMLYPKLIFLDVITSIKAKKLSKPFFADADLKVALILHSHNCVKKHKPRNQAILKHMPHLPIS